MAAPDFFSWGRGKGGRGAGLVGADISHGKALDGCMDDDWGGSWEVGVPDILFVSPGHYSGAGRKHAAGAKKLLTPKILYIAVREF